MCFLLSKSRRKKKEHHGRKILGIQEGQGGVPSLRDKNAYVCMHNVIHDL